MRHKLALILANTGLLAVTLVLLAGPLLLGQLLSVSQSGALGVSQVAPAGRQLSVYANTTDFSRYALFNPSPIIEPLFYQTSVTFSVFGGQQATYNGLLTLYNSGASPLTVSVESGTLSGAADGVEVWLTVAQENRSSVTLVTEAAAVGATEIKVADAEGYSQGQVIMAGQALKAVKKNATTLVLSRPLAEPVQSGEKVYLGAAYYNQQLKPIVAKTQPIVLPPEGRASISLTAAVEGSADQRQVVLPLSITAE